MKNDGHSSNWFQPTKARLKTVSYARFPTCSDLVLYIKQNGFGIPYMKAHCC